MGDLSPLALVVSHQDLVVEAVRLDIDGQHVVGKMEELGQVPR
jgi:hypothetical protein